MAPGERPAPDDYSISSDFSSGCQSGWTAYLDHSAAAPQYPSDDLFCSKDGGPLGGDDDEEEDMSMVSDASSGPPQLFRETEGDEDENDGGSGKCKRRRVVELAEHEDEQEDSLSDDTATSLLFPHSMTATFVCGEEDDTAASAMAAKKVEFSCGFSSATHFKRKLESSAPIEATQESRSKIR